MSINVDAQDRCAESLSQRYQALLQMIESTVAHPNLATLLKDMAGWLLGPIATFAVDDVLKSDDAHASEPQRTCGLENAFPPEDMERLSQFAPQLTAAAENSPTGRELDVLKRKLTQGRQDLEEEIQTAYNFAEIIGRSAAIKRVMQQVEIVAPTNATVLIQGETGTGKELLARAIHYRSTRKHRTLVKVNCAAIPTGLLESELFGHEKGAFTGAIERCIGRFELAHQGTLFLDEVGDIPLELQPKLLRVLQEHEFERLGSTRTIRTDVRLITATNRDLAPMVADKQFRGDLYYRLNVFPLALPPLRERPEDIPLLTRAFAHNFARLMKKRIETIPAEAQDALARYSWPGNIRELRNAVERALILAPGKVVTAADVERLLPTEEGPATGGTSIEAAPGQTFEAFREESEKQFLIQKLREHEWNVSETARAIKMPRSNLYKKIERHGINRDTA
jgi:formate hydrogenlyase transcriptional activator